jgi:hypothetical protein
VCSSDLRLAELIDYQRPAGPWTHAGYANTP